MVKNLLKQETKKHMSLILKSRRSPGGGHGNPLQCSCLESPRDRGVCWTTVHGVAKSWTGLKQLSTPRPSACSPEARWASPIRATPCSPASHAQISDSLKAQSPSGLIAGFCVSLLAQLFSKNTSHYFFY